VEDTRPCAFFWGASSTLRYGGGREGGQLEDFVGKVYPNPNLSYNCNRNNYLIIKVSATQLETEWQGRSSEEAILSYGDAIAAAIHGHVHCHFNY